MNIDNTKLKKIFLSITFCLLLAFVLCLLSPLNPFLQKYYGTDSMVFQYNALAMKNGMLPYVDFFDHKGILLYVINLIGIIINKKIGIWIIEFIFMFFTLIYSKKTLSLFTKNEKTKYFVLLLVIMTLSISFEGGNLTEEYYLPFAIISQYIFCKYLLNKSTKSIEIIFLGFAFAVVCLLRINMIGLWGVYVLIILIKLFIEKKYKDIFKYMGLFILGLLIIFIPTFTYMISNNIFGAFIDSYLIFNLKYSSVSLFDKYNSFIYFSSILIVLVALVSNMLFLFNKNNFNKNILIANMLSLIVNLVAISLSGKTYMHYAMVLIPNLLIPYILLLIYFSKNEKMKFIILLYLIIYILKPSITSYIDNLKFIKSYDNSEYLNTADYIKNNTSEKDKISIFGNKNILYVLSNRYSASKYSYQTPIIDYDKKIFEEYVNDISINKPKIIYFYEESLELRRIVEELGYIETQKNMFLLENEV